MAGPFREQIITNGSMASNVTSLTVDVTFKEWVGIQCVYTGSPVGTLEIDVSNDGTNWTTAASVAVSSASSTFFSLNYATSEFVRILYTASSGSGTLNAIVQAKGF